MRTAAHYIAVNTTATWNGLKPSIAAGIESGVAGAGQQQKLFTQATATFG